MDLIIDNKIINAPIPDILKQIKKETGANLFKDIQFKRDNYVITCPQHKGGQENHPSCNIYCGDSPEVEYGTVHCFTCGYSVPLYKLVADCFNEKDDFGKAWLVDRFGDTFIETQRILPAIDVSKKASVKKLDESILREFDYYHPYMWTRKLSRDIVDKFRVGYDKATDALTFPVYDEHNNLVMITKRSVSSKAFHIDENVDKPVYLLNYIQSQNIKTVIIVESQINALTAWTYGYPAVALFGTGSEHQYDILNKSCIRHYILMFDGDSAGDSGAKRFIKNIRKDVFVDVVKLPRGKDVNDLSKEQFLDLFKQIS